MACAYLFVFSFSESELNLVLSIWGFCMELEFNRLNFYCLDLDPHDFSLG